MGAALKLLCQTECVQASGGMPLKNDESCRRTAGGVFLKLLRESSDSQAVRAWEQIKKAGADLKKLQARKKTEARRAPRRAPDHASRE